jgi:hypothetical protein
MILFLKGDGIDDGFYSVLKISQLQHVEKMQKKMQKNLIRFLPSLKDFL